MLTTTELFLLAMLVILAVPYLLWRGLGGDRLAPLAVVQIVTGVLLGPGVLGAALPTLHAQVFMPGVMQALNGVAWWGVMLFVWLAGVELDLRDAWRHRRESTITSGLALVLPLVLGAGVGVVLWQAGGWQGPQGQALPFVLGIGMACAVTALPILVLLMEQMGLLRQPLGQRVLRYASLDDIALWGVLALVLAEWQRLGRQAVFLLAFVLLAWALRRALPRLRQEGDRWALSLVWLLACALGADWCGLHYMVGAFLAGTVIDADGLGQARLEAMRRQVLLLLMPVFFLSTGLRTQWQMGGSAVLLAAAALLLAAVVGKLLGVHLAGRWLGWPVGQAWVVGWLLQTKALIMIIFANVLLDKGVIAASTFTALLLMAVASTVLTVPMVRPHLARLGLARLPSAQPLPGQAEGVADPAAPQQPTPQP